MCVVWVPESETDSEVPEDWEELRELKEIQMEKNKVRGMDSTSRGGMPPVMAAPSPGVAVGGGCPCGK